ncbi:MULTISPECIES: tyrosine recombinase XerC [unclassified Uliginosibacterium]|uniref:tyrosine recombinase XerC n=1 Tax=unclassified Uliginosibacterium TaxID=2621521 RepID=UPI000C7AC79F|nr:MULTISPECIES: tyrosine recombinase XerC [unclassified Uliginosibacterium]MDO6386145.1 tyrosine recombinase XerC [Uliginosibacterium sp. 31-12]PLK49214.1 tyrosine recombinase XerC [Uliginosibacterium sp. TH139]
MNEQASAILPAEAIAWLDYLAQQRRVSPHTLTNYRRELGKLHAFAAPRTFAELKPADIRRFAAKLHAGGLEARSIARALSCWRGLFRWLLAREQVSSNPVLGIRPPRAGKLLPKALSVDAASALLDALPEDALEIRDLAMFELLYSSGLRLAELAALDIDGLYSIADGEVTVLGKRNKTRRVPVGTQALNALENWLAVRATLAANGESALFLSQRGTRLSHGAIQARLARWAREKGAPQHVHPHMLRHSFASHVLQSSGDLRAVQELLGHASIRSTQVYTHLDFQHLAKIYDAAHPRAKKKD